MCVCVCVRACVHVCSTALFVLSDRGLMEIPRQWGWTTYQVPATSRWWRRCFSPSFSSSFFPSLIHTLPLLRVISQAALKWPPAIFPNPSYMLFGAVSSKRRLHSPEQRGCHCAVTGSIDFLWEVGKFCLMAPHLKGLIPLVRSWGFFLVEVWGGGKLWGSFEPPASSFSLGRASWPIEASESIL